MNPTAVFLSLLGTALAVSAVGFLRLIWFISVGYGYAIAALALVLGGWAAPAGLTVLLALQLALLFAYGVRLGTFVLLREKQAAYRQAVQATYGEATGGLGLKYAIWGAVSLLYVAMFSPAVFHALRAEPVPPLAVAGLGVMTGGLCIEVLADRQKSVAKRLNPARFCDRGLFSWVRCPAYFGEMLFGVGNSRRGTRGFPACRLVLSNKITFYPRGKMLAGGLLRGRFAGWRSPSRAVNHPVRRWSR